MHGRGAAIVDSQQPVEKSVPACAPALALALAPVPTLSTTTATSAAIASALIATFHKSLPPINAWLVESSGSGASWSRWRRRVQGIDPTAASTGISRSTTGDRRLMIDD